MYHLPPHTFKTQKEADSHFRKILSSEITQADIPTLTALLNRHPEAEEKLKDFSFFSIVKDGWGGRCFAVVTTDGRTVPFSKKACLSAKPTTTMIKARACRQAITEQVLAFKNMSGGCKCGSYEKLEVDHINPFCDILAAWPHQPEIEHLEYGRFKWLNNAQLLDWQKHHRRTATLQMLCHSCHYAKTFNRNLR